LCAVGVVVALEEKASFLRLLFTTLNAMYALALEALLSDLNPFTRGFYPWEPTLRFEV
jgi:hypothetical protein